MCFAPPSSPLTRRVLGGLRASRYDVAMPMLRPFLAVSALAAAGLAACAPQPQAPTNPGVCWHMVLHGKDKAPTYNVVSKNVPALENCAANLEALRVEFLSKGGNRSDLNGAYQGTFIFINQQGIYASQTFNGTPYLALVRSGDGRLVVPGAMPST